VAIAVTLAERYKGYLILFCVHKS